MTTDDHQVQSFDCVCERVLAEHTELRRLLHRLLAAARAIIELETTSENELRGAINAVALAFDHHVWMEEKHLIPLLADAGGWSRRRMGKIVNGNVRATLMLDEHRQQREVVFALLSEATAGEKSGPALAEDACWLAESLMKDIHIEEAELVGTYTRAA